MAEEIPLPDVVKELKLSPNKTAREDLSISIQIRLERCT